MSTTAQNTMLGHVAAHLGFGVAAFFVISGFLLYRPFLAAAVGDAPKMSYRGFYWRRVLRILPAYWLALILLAPLLAYSHPGSRSTCCFR